MSQKADGGVCVFGALAIEKHLKTMAEQAAGVRLAKDSEYIHDMRVASRRLRDTLRLFSACLPRQKYKDWRDQIHSLTQALGQARDTDVQMGVLQQFVDTITDKTLLPGLNRLMLRLRQKRKQYQEDVIITLDNLEKQNVLQKLHEQLEPLVALQDQTYLYTPALYNRGYKTITRRLETFLSYQAYVEQPECIAELHAMRIAAKHLRYTMEAFSPIYPGELKGQIQTLRKNQDLLGEVHDCDVWIAFLPGFIGEERQFTQEFFGSLRGFRRLVPGVECFLQNRQQVREQKYQEFVDFWNLQKREGVWERVNTVVQIPFFKGEPPAAEKAEAAPSS